MKRRVVITGGAGFVGSHAASHFAKRHWEVVILDNFSRGQAFSRSGQDSASYNWSSLRSIPGVRLVRGSVSDPRVVRAAIRDAEFVIHLAAQVAVTTSLLKPRDDFLSNAVGTFNILEACRLARTSPRVVYASTNKVYGANINAIPVAEGKTRYRFRSSRFRKGIPESFPVDHTDHSPYGVSKLVGDLYAQEFGHTYGLATGVFRMSCIYGPRQIGVADQGWVSHFVLSALQNQPIKIYGDGKQVRDVLYVSDLIAALESYLRSRLGPEVFNTGGGERNTLSLVELISHLQDRLKRTIQISYHPWRPADQKVYVSDVSRLSKVLDWHPSVDPASGVDRLIDWGRDWVVSQHSRRATLA